MRVSSYFFFLVFCLSFTLVNQDLEANDDQPYGLELGGGIGLQVGGDDTGNHGLRFDAGHLRLRGAFLYQPPQLFGLKNLPRVGINGSYEDISESDGVVPKDRSSKFSILSQERIRLGAVLAYIGETDRLLSYDLRLIGGGAFRRWFHTNDIFPRAKVQLRTGYAFIDLSKIVRGAKGFAGLYLTASAEKFFGDDGNFEEYRFSFGVMYQEKSKEALLRRFGAGPFILRKRERVGSSSDPRFASLRWTKVGLEGFIELGDVRVNLWIAFDPSSFRGRDQGGRINSTSRYFEAQLNIDLLTFFGKKQEPPSRPRTQPAYRPYDSGGYRRR